MDEAKELLYGYPVDSFVAERDALVKAIRANGDRELANLTKTLRKPSAVAALVNQVVRQDPDGVELILQAAALLRSAQAGALEGSGVNASELQQQYRAAVGALAQSAPDRRAEVRAALEAATIDQASNQDLRTGCLVVVPSPVSIFGASANVSGDDPPAQAVDSADPAQPVDELQVRRERRQAQREAKDETAAEQEREATQEKVAEKKAAAEAAQKQAAEKKAAAEAERQRKAAERERKKQLKELQKLHRDALRSHLTALDDEAAAAQAAEHADQELANVDTDIAVAEDALVALRERRVATMSQQAELEQAQAEAAVRADDAQGVVDALAERLAALETQT